MFHLLIGEEDEPEPAPGRRFARAPAPGKRPLTARAYRSASGTAAADAGEIEPGRPSLLDSQRRSASSSMRARSSRAPSSSKRRRARSPSSSARASWPSRAASLLSTTQVRAIS